jgi:hypothetical protein
MLEKIHSGDVYGDIDEFRLRTNQMFHPVSEA